jgi:hypothetical protein
VFDERLADHGCVPVAIDRVDCTPPTRILAHRLPTAAAAPLRLEPVLGEGTFAIAIGDGDTPVRTTFVVDADTEWIAVPWSPPVTARPR